MKIALVINFLFIIFQPNLVRCDDYDDLYMMISKIKNVSSVRFNVTCAAVGNYGTLAIATNSPLMTNLTVKKNEFCHQSKNCNSKHNINLPPSGYNQWTSEKLRVGLNKRWEDLPNKNYFYYNFPDILTLEKDISKVIYFSVRSQNGFKLVVEEKQDHGYELTVNENLLTLSKLGKIITQHRFPYQNNHWNTYILYLSSNKSTTEISLRDNYTKILWKYSDQTNAIIPYNVKTGGEAEWKYRFVEAYSRYSTGETHSQHFNVSTLGQNEELLYLSLYFALCDNCALNIYFHDTSMSRPNVLIASIVNKIKTTGIYTYACREWKEFQFQVDRNSKSGYLIFDAVIIDHTKKEKLFWRVDKVILSAEKMPEFNSESSIIEIPKDIPSLDTINCQLLHEKPILSKWSLPLTSSFDVFCSNSFLKSQCKSECDKAETFESCKGVTFCSPKNCFCAPGYNGTYCSNLIYNTTVNKVISSTIRSIVVSKSFTAEKSISSVATIVENKSTFINENTIVPNTTVDIVVSTTIRSIAVSEKFTEDENTTSEDSIKDTVLYSTDFTEDKSISSVASIVENKSISKNVSSIMLLIIFMHFYL